jgi:hypothetical protein
VRRPGGATGHGYQLGRRSAPPFGPTLGYFALDAVAVGQLGDEFANRVVSAAAQAVHVALKAQIVR